MVINEKIPDKVNTDDKQTSRGIFLYVNWQILWCNVEGILINLGDRFKFCVNVKN